ncbi:hypothetical protein TEA_009214 [Camellia sinensis var. sinensis]|uniref:Uncharacterized protein n=1 Tax=Camellia sinensis var. sinensis TaxID=542762 RepID=A0A4S4ED45_CAMSN|nr:hypothetical protein TEA_009214 [Camellia sinensis var. sinensis]
MSLISKRAKLELSKDRLGWVELGSARLGSTQLICSPRLEDGRVREGYDIIDVLPWDEWWNFELTKDESNPHISLLPLHPDVRAMFNETAAWEYAFSMVGKPYGYHHLIFSWIDTIDGNYPPPLDAHVVASVMTVWNNVQPHYAANMWNEALNK